MYLMINLMDESATAEFVCAKRLDTLSMTLYAS